MAALQWVDSSGYDSTVSAYGIITRVLTFGFYAAAGPQLRNADDHR